MSKPTIYVTDTTIENGVSRVRDVTFDEDRLHGRKIGFGLSGVRNVAITLLRQLGLPFIPEAQRAVAVNPVLAFALFALKFRTLRSPIEGERRKNIAQGSESQKSKGRRQKVVVQFCNLRCGAIL